MAAAALAAAVTGAAGYLRPRGGEETRPPPHSLKTVATRI